MKLLKMDRFGGVDSLEYPFVYKKGIGKEMKWGLLWRNPIGKSN